MPDWKQIAPGITRQDGVSVYGWRTTDREGFEVQLTWSIGDHALMISTRPASGGSWGRAKPLNRERWSVIESSLEAAQRVVEEFIREVVWS